ncbi:MAG: energy-coupling factor transporter transmembrane component T [Faecousia sp.]
MRRDAFSGCHPAVNFLFFVGAIGFGATIQHPAYCAAGCICAAIYYLMLTGRKGFKMLLSVAVLFVLMSAVNPLLNKSGKHVLFTWFGRPYTLEALYYGMALGAIMVVMLLWFGCYSAVLTSDKFTALFGRLIPALSLLLVMVLRMIPAFTRKAKQILLARRCIGKGASQAGKLTDKAKDGASVLSALTDWALEGSIITADSMRSRGYGTGKRTNFQIYRMTGRDYFLLALILGLEIAVLCLGGTGASFTPRLKIDPIGFGLPVYCVLLLIPTLLQIKEVIAWRISISRI